MGGGGGHPGQGGRGGGQAREGSAPGCRGPPVHSPPSAPPPGTPGARGCRRHRIRSVRTPPTAFPPRIRTQASPPRPTWDRIADTVTNPSSRRKNANAARSEEHTSELQSPCNLVCRLLLEKKKESG